MGKNFDIICFRLLVRSRITAFHVVDISSNLIGSTLKNKILYGKHSTETKQKISNSIKLAYKQGKFKNKGISYISKERREEINKETRDRYKNKFESLSWNDLPLNQKRKRVLKEQNGKYLICGTSEWQGNPLTLHFDHINGDNTNNKRENVRYLCPNCHSQTKTYCGNKQKLPQFEYLKTTKERLKNKEM